MLEHEEWRTVPGFPKYDVSSHGRIRRAASGHGTYAGRILTTHLTPYGYERINLRRGDSAAEGMAQPSIHALVAAAFLGPRPARLEINHIDGNKLNNAASNLEYVSHAENMAHASRRGLMRRGEFHPQTRLSDANVRAMRDRYEDGEPIADIARRFGMSYVHTYGIVKRTKRRSVA